MGHDKVGDSLKPPQRLCVVDQQRFATKIGTGGNDDGASPHKRYSGRTKYLKDEVMQRGRGQHDTYPR